MKKLLTLVLAFVALASIVSCGGDDDTKLGELEIDGNVLNDFVLNAYVYEDANGTGLQRGNGASGYYTEFFLTDGTFTLDQSGNATNFTYGQSEFEIYLYTYSDGPSFAGGNYIMWDDCVGGALNGMWFYAYWFDGSNEYEYYGASGGATITGTGPIYTIALNGTVYDNNDCAAAVRGNNHCSSDCTAVNISGEVKATFTEWSGVSI